MPKHERHIWFRGFWSGVAVSVLVFALAFGLGVLVAAGVFAG